MNAPLLIVSRMAMVIAGVALSLPVFAGDGTNSENEEVEFVEPKSYNSSRDLRDIPSIPITSWLHIGLLLEAEAKYEKVGGRGRDEITADAFSVAANAEWREGISLFAVAKQELNRERDLDVEEAFLHLGATEEIPWYLEAGRMEMPFGEFEGRFVEDALVQVIGETEGDGYVVGYETETWEAVISVFQGNLADNDMDNVVGALKFDLWDGIEFGVSFTSDLGESMELNSLQRDHVSDGEADSGDEEEDEEEEGGDEEEEESSPEKPLRLSDDAVAGLGAFVIIDLESWVYGLETIVALDEFGAGVLDDPARRPWAANGEIAFRPASGLEVAARLEYAEELPDEPQWQTGVAALWAVADHVTVGANVLHALFRAGESDRTLFGMELAIEF